MSSDSQDEDHYPAESDEDEMDDETVTAKPPDGTAMGLSVLAVDVLDLLDQVYIYNTV